MQLSRNFSLEEFEVSNKAHQLNIDNKVKDSQVVKHLMALCATVLQPVRDKFGAIRVTSGYRCNLLNLAVKGSVNSNHLYGYAADIQCGDKLMDIFNFIKDNLPYDELLFEHSKNATWLHVAYRCDKENRKKTNSNYRV